MLLAASLAGPPPARADATFKCGIVSINDVQHEWCKRLSARVEKATNGFLKGQTYPAAQLGPTARLIEGVQFGTIEVIMVPPDFLIGLDPRFMAMTAPYLFDSLEHAHRVLNDKEFLDRFLALPEPKGMVGISMVVYGPSGFAMRAPVRTPDDLKGKKIRMNATPFERAMLSAVGASGVPMGINEALTAIQQGTVDGVQSAPHILTAFKFYDSAKYYAHTGHFTVTCMGLVNKRWLESLPPNVQKVLLEEARAVQPELIEVSRQMEVTAVATWKEQTKDGWMELTPAQKNAFRSRFEGIDAKVIAEHPAARETIEFVRRKARELK
jgi:TRAP-type C4-dicarboxylate transport system substrate-binding protein